VQCQIFEVKHGRPLYFYCVQTCNNIAAWLDKSINWANSFFSCDWFFFSVQICNNILANAATPSIVYCCTWLYVSRTFWQFCTKKFECEPCTEWCAKVCGCKLWIQLYLSMQSCLLQPSFCQVLPVLVHVASQPTPACADCHAVVALMRGTRARWFVPWHDFSSCRIHPQWRLYCQL